VNILIVSHYFYPENFKVNDIAFDFVKKGHKVTVLTGKPNYPKGKFFRGYTFFNKTQENIKGVNVIRVPLFPRFNSSAKYLVMNYLSFLVFSFFAVHFRVKGSFDVIFSHLPSPLTSAIPGIWLKNKFKVPLVLWVLDLWPESVSANSNINGGLILRFLKNKIQDIYNNADKILVSSKTFKISIIDKFNIEETKIKYFPNWAEDVFINKQEFNEVIPSLPKGFNVMFAGNIGDSQDFESIVKAAKETKGKVNWILIGDGRKFEWIKKQKEQGDLDNLYLLGRFSLEAMPKFFKKADAMLVSLKDEPTFALTIPAKVQAYMASQKIILGMLNGEGKDLINESQSGFAVNAKNYKGLVKNALKIKGLSKEDRNKIEKFSLEYYKNNFSKHTLLSDLENTLKEIGVE
jgi:glycosyltransferase involved in cell wall biosynthesis